MDLLQVLSSSILQVMCALVMTAIQANCVLWNDYKKIFSDKICLADHAKNGFHATNLLMCLASCSRTSDCGALIYNRQKTTCYRLKIASLLDDCSTGLKGALLFKKGICPFGWTLVDESCYTLLNDEQNQASHAANCKSFGNNVHLADTKTLSELEKVKEWLRSQHVDHRQLIYIGGKDKKWSDGTIVNPKWNGHDYPNSFMCHVVTTRELLLTRCVRHFPGICEMDMH